MELFDLDVLRTFVLLDELGSLARAAEAQRRTLSAASLQLARLEAQAGRPLLRKSGRRLVPTPEGRALLHQARRLLELNRQAFETLRTASVRGRLAFGLPQDVAEASMPRVLAAFARTHPQLELDIRVDRRTRLLEAFSGGLLDVILFWAPEKSLPGAEPVARFPMAWQAPLALKKAPVPLPLIVFDGNCFFRSAAESSLKKARLPYRLALLSDNLSAIWSGVEAGLGLTVRTDVGRKNGVRTLRPGAFGLPSLPDIGLHLKTRAKAPAAAAALVRLLKEGQGLQGPGFPEP
jgi:DNA-binding transcriptional LysR family regulator